MLFVQIVARFVRTTAVTLVRCSAILIVLAGIGITAQQEPAVSVSHTTSALPQQSNKNVTQNEETVYAPPPIYSLPSHLSLCGEKVPLHIPQVRESMDREFIIAVYNRAQSILWLKRSTRYYCRSKEL